MVWTQESYHKSMKYQIYDRPGECSTAEDCFMMTLTDVSTTWAKVIITVRLRLWLVSNFGDGDCGAGEIHTHAREISRRRDTRGTAKIRIVPLASRLLEISRACVCILPARQSPSPKLETTCSLSAAYHATMLRFKLRLLPLATMFILHKVGAYSLFSFNPGAFSFCEFYNWQHSCQISR